VTLARHGADVYVHGMTLLSRSSWLREQWVDALWQLGWPVLGDGKVRQQLLVHGASPRRALPAATSVKLLESFVRKYMKSRQKRCRWTDGRFGVAALYPLLRHCSVANVVRMVGALQIATRLPLCATT
jgi:hypothetical protein